MRAFIYKAIVITLIIIVSFEFTIGKRLDPIVQSMNRFGDEQGRKGLIEKVRKEMRKGLEKEYMLREEDRILIYKFYNKLINEINSVEQN